jgi:hypothetical protein
MRSWVCLLPSIGIDLLLLPPSSLSGPPSPNSSTYLVWEEREGEGEGFTSIHLHRIAWALILMKMHCCIVFQTPPGCLIRTGQVRSTCNFD